MATIIVIGEADAYDREHYGITGRSVGTYYVTGPNVHNRHHAHQINVWDNTVRPNRTQGEPVRYVGNYGMKSGGPGKYRDPNGNDTDAATSVLMSAQASVITAHAALRPTPAVGTLTVGDVVTLVDGVGRLIGTYRVTSKMLSDPYLAPIDEEN
jgi:hypothetical protein